MFKFIAGKQVIICDECAEVIAKERKAATFQNNRYRCRMMRTFRHTSPRKNRQILSVFPMLKSEFWDESPDLTYRAVSIWDHWLSLSDDQDLLTPRSHDEYVIRCQKFEKLDELMVENTAVYLVAGGKSVRFKELSCENQLRARLSPNYAKGGFLLALPELKMIYTSGDRDEHTRVTYYQVAAAAAPFDQWVAAAGLKYIEEYSGSSGQTP